MTRESTRHMKLICNDVILRLSHATIANFWSVNNRRLTYKITLMVVLNFSTLPFNKNFCSSFCTDLDFFSFFFFFFFFFGGGGGVGRCWGVGTINLLMGSRGEGHGRLSYTALWQTLNSHCEQEIIFQIWVFRVFRIVALWIKHKSSIFNPSRPVHFWKLYCNKN